MPIPKKEKTLLEKRSSANSKKLYKPLFPRSLMSFTQALKDILSRKVKELPTELKSSGVRPDEVCGGVLEEYNITPDPSLRVASESQDM